jgi:hypothetical protein
VQVDGEDAVGAGGGYQLGHDLGRDRHAGAARATILAGVAEVRHDRGDACRRSPAQGVDHHQHLDQMVVDRRAGRLHDEHVAAAHILKNLDLAFAIRETVTMALPSGMCR